MFRSLCLRLPPTFSLSPSLFLRLSRSCRCRSSELAIIMRKYSTWKPSRLLSTPFDKGRFVRKIGAAAVAARRGVESRLPIAKRGLLPTESLMRFNFTRKSVAQVSLEGCRFSLFELHLLQLLLVLRFDNEMTFFES